MINVISFLEKIQTSLDDATVEIVYQRNKTLKISAAPKATNTDLEPRSVFWIFTEEQLSFCGNDDVLAKSFIEFAKNEL